MSYTVPTPCFESDGIPASSYAGFKEFIVWLNGRHLVRANAVPWAIIDCYDGTTREQPLNGDSANLSAANKWREDQAVPPEDAWIVLQAPSGGDVVARYQIYGEMTALAAVFIGIFMLNDWAVGAGTDANPDIPATSLGVPPGAGGMNGTIADHPDYVWRAVADEGTIYVGAYPTTFGFPDFMYIGDLKPDNPASIDPRPFVISRNPDAQGWDGIYFHVSVVDDTTIIDSLDELAQKLAFADTQDQDAGWTTRPLCEVACYSNEINNFYRKGKFRLCAGISRHARTVTIERVTCGIDATDFSLEVHGRGGTAEPQVVTKHCIDVALDRHIIIVERTIPELL